MVSAYTVPVGRIRKELEIKKSRFICTIDYIETEQQGKEIRHLLQQEFPTANHHCWAHQLGSPQSILQACSDDGEPHGTAGKPILNQLHHAKLLQVQAVVTRLFGGVKLGTGGLVRAYSDATALVIQNLTTEALIEWQRIELAFSYDLEALVRQTVTRLGMKNDRWQYTEQVVLSCQIPLDCVAEVQETLRNLSAGRLLFKRVE